MLHTVPFKMFSCLSCQVDYPASSPELSSLDWHLCSYKNPPIYTSTDEIMVSGTIKYTALLDYSPGRLIVNMINGFSTSRIERISRNVEY